MGCCCSSAKQHVRDESTKGGIEQSVGVRKLNVVALHGTTMSGESMRNYFQWKECGISGKCCDIANFYYPSGPCVVSPKHAIWKAAPGAGPPGPDKRHWWTMGDKWDFSPKAFAAARKTICNFIDKEVQAPVDVLIGYSQGAAACTQVMNDVLTGALKNAHLAQVKGVIFLGCPNHPTPNANFMAWEGKTLHCNGDSDPLTSLKGAKEHAAKVKHDVFFAAKLGHELHPQQPYAEPIRQFLISLA